MFKWFKNLAHKCPTNNELEELERENELLRTELSYEERRHILVEWKFKLDKASKEYADKNDYT